MKFFYVLAILAVTGVYNVASKEKCHMRYLQECSAPFIALAGSGNVAEQTPTTEPELDKMCEGVREAVGCALNFTNECFTPLMKRLIPTYTPRLNDYLDRMCKPGGDVREQYLKLAPCLKEAAQTEEARACVEDLHAAAEKIDENTESPLDSGCCAFSRFRKCSEAVVEAKCGNEAIEYVQFLTRNGLASIVSRTCSCIDSDSEECKNLLPPEGTKPEGAKSSNPLAAFFATVVKY